MAIVKPSKPFIRYTFGTNDSKELDLENNIISTGRLEVAAAGLYAPGYIDVERLVGAIESEADFSTVELGILASVKSGLPGFLVGPAIEKLLTETDFAARSLDGLRIYHRAFDMENAGLTFLVRTDGNQIYGALSSNPSYAATLITGVNQ